VSFEGRAAALDHGSLADAASLLTPSAAAVGNETAALQQLLARAMVRLAEELRRRGVELPVR
jgi:hypothetical protein